MTKGFVPTGYGNEILKCDGFMISYRAGTRGTTGIEMVDLVISGDDNGLGETAIVFDKDDRTLYLILNGDFRNEYEKLSLDGLDSCIDFFTKNRDKKSAWSNDVDPILDEDISGVLKMLERASKKGLN